jgi:hypothetical protein
VQQLIDLAREHELRVLEPFGFKRAVDLKKVLRKMIELHARGEMTQDEDEDDLGG